MEIRELQKSYMRVDGPASMPLQPLSFEAVSGGTYKNVKSFILGS